MCISICVIFVGKALTSLWCGESSDRGLWLTSHQLPPSLGWTPGQGGVAGAPSDRFPPGLSHLPLFRYSGMEATTW